MPRSPWHVRIVPLRATGSHDQVCGIALGAITSGRCSRTM
jgi:hypothetical protein